MKNKIIIAAVCMSLAGCASLRYPNWEQVKIEPSVFKKPCEYKAAERCTGSSLECPNWYKKRATLKGSNTVELAPNSATARYFYCAAGIPLFIAKPESIWIIRNKFKPAATRLDFEQAIAECEYESHKATIDISKPLQSRVYTGGLDNYMDNELANRTDVHNQALNKTRISREKAILNDECLQAKGFITTHTSDEKSLADLNKYCPDIDNYTTPCFILGAQ